MWKKLKKGIKKAANAVAKVANKIGDAAADAVAAVGNGIGDGLTWLSGKIPDAGVLGWLGDVISAAFTFIASLIKGGFAILAGLLSGFIKIIGGILTLDLDGILEGFGDIGSGIAGGVIAIVGALIGLVQVIFTIGRPRRLNARERELVSLVFQHSIATYNVRVVDGNAGLFSLNSRPFCLGDTIYMKKYEANTDPAVFVHECIHVWQNQHFGSRYTAEALYSQWWGVGYDWEQEASGGKDWDVFEREAQGMSIETVFNGGGVVRGATGGGAFFAEDDEMMRVFVSPATGVDWTSLANAATRSIRGATPWRLTGLA